MSITIRPGDYERFRLTAMSFDPNSKIRSQTGRIVTLDSRLPLDEVKGFTSVESASEIITHPIKLIDFVEFYRECRMGAWDLTMGKDHLHAPIYSCDVVRSNADCDYKAMVSYPSCNLGSITHWESEIQAGRGDWIIRRTDRTNATYLSYGDGILIIGFH